MIKEYEYKYIVYLTTNTINLKIYIGVHKVYNNKFMDGYIGNGVYNNISKKSLLNKTSLFRKAVAKYGYDNFNRTIIAIFNKEIDAYNLEETLVNNDFVRNNNTYNLVIGGKKGYAGTNKVRVDQYTLSGKFIKTWESATEAGKTYSKAFIEKGSKIISVCKSFKTAYGYQWRYRTKKSTSTIKPFKRKVSSRSRKLYQFDGKLNLLNTWVSISEAQNTLNLTNIYRAAVNSTLAGNYYWSFNNIITKKTRSVRRLEVMQYNKNGDLIKIWLNPQEAKKSGFSNIYKVLKGDRKYSNGYSFKYKT